VAVRKVVLIDEELCDGCGDCVPSCAEGAIQIIDNKAKLVGDALCDGLGACLGDCPQGAITVEEREAEAFDEEAVKVHLTQLAQEQGATASTGEPGGGAAHAAAPQAQELTAAPAPASGCGCPGAAMKDFSEAMPGAPAGPAGAAAGFATAGDVPSALRQWPIQLHLVPPTAPYFKGADVLLAADCTAFAIGGFHGEHLNGRALAIACPKLDQGMEIYLQKLVNMIDDAGINTLTVMVMEVPCCSGLVRLAREAAEQAQRKVPVKHVVVGIRGDILGEDWL